MKEDTNASERAFGFLAWSGVAYGCGTDPTTEASRDFWEGGLLAGLVPSLTHRLSRGFSRIWLRPWLIDNRARSFADAEPLCAGADEERAVCRRDTIHDGVEILARRLLPAVFRFRLAVPQLVRRD